MSSTNNTKTYHKQNSQGGDSKQTQQKSKTSSRGGRNTNAPSTTGYRKPSVKRKFDVPLRTTSAPPDLSVQQKHSQLAPDAMPFIPKKYNPYMGFGQGSAFYPYGFPQNFARGRGGKSTPVYKPSQPQFNQQTSGGQLSGVTKPPARKAVLKIVNPKTGEDILTGEKVLDLKPEPQKEIKSEEKKPPIETKSEDIKPEETKKEDTKPIETKPEEKKQEETKPTKEIEKAEVVSKTVSQPEQKTETIIEEKKTEEVKQEVEQKTEEKVEEKKEQIPIEIKDEEKKEQIPEIRIEENHIEETKQEKEDVVETKPEESKTESNQELTTKTSSAPASESEEYEEDEEEGEGDDEEEESEEEEVPEVPQTKTGIRQYSKEMLLKFRPKVTEPPEELRGMDVFQDANAPNRPPPSPTGPPRMGGYAKRGARGKRESIGGRGRGYSGKYRGGKPKRGVKKEKLVKGENAWKAGDENMDEAEKIYAHGRDILNKITDKTYEKLKKSFLEIKIPSAEILKGIIDQIYEHAVRFPAFSHLFADLCKDLSDHQAENEKDNAFKKLLLNKCQDEFQKTPNAKAELEKIRAEKDEDEALELSTKIRKRMVGNIVFIGELFKRSMLSEKITHEIIKQLLIKKELPDEDELEVLCNLLKSVGKLLDHERAKRYMDFYFDKLKNLSKSKEVPSRLRFMLMDTVELRESGWKVQKEEEPPKPKQDVRKDPDYRGKDRREPYGKGRGRDRQTDSRGRGRGEMSRTAKEKLKRQAEKTEVSQSQDGWSIAKPLKITQKRMTPGTGLNQGAQGWRKESDDIRLNTQNTFSALSIDDDENRSPQTPTSPKEEEQKSATPEEVESATESVIKIYLDDQEHQDAVDSILKISPDDHPIVVKTMVISALEKSESHRAEIASLMISMKKEIKSWPKAVEIGLDKALDTIAEDGLWIDMPMCFRIIGSFLGQFILNEVTTFDFVDKLVTKHCTKLKPKHILELVGTFVKTQKSEHEENDTLEKFYTKLSTSSFNVLRYINPSNPQEVNDLLKYYKLQDIVDCDIVVQLLDGIKEGTDTATIVGWVKGLSVTDKNIARKVSCAVLAGVELVTRFAQAENYENAEKDLIKKYSPVLAEILKNKKNQVATLTEAQYIAFKAKFKNGILVSLFKNLYEAKLVEKDAFSVWKSEAKDAPGKKEAVKEVESFISQL